MIDPKDKQQPWSDDDGDPVGGIWSSDTDDFEPDPEHGFGDDNSMEVD